MISWLSRSCMSLALGQQTSSWRLSWLYFSKQKVDVSHTFPSVLKHLETLAVLYLGSCNKWWEGSSPKIILIELDIWIIFWPDIFWGRNHLLCGCFVGDSWWTKVLTLLCFFFFIFFVPRPSNFCWECWSIKLMGMNRLYCNCFSRYCEMWNTEEMHVIDRKSVV